MNMIVLVTAQNSSQAKRIGQALLEAHVIACVNIVPGVQSLFWWQGKVDSSKEVLMVMKTQKRCFNKIVTIVKRLHSYQTPEIVALPIVLGERAYMQWLEASCSSR